MMSMFSFGMLLGLIYNNNKLKEKCIAIDTQKNMSIIDTQKNFVQVDIPDIIIS